MKHTLKTLAVELTALKKAWKDDTALRQRLLDERFQSQQVAVREANQNLIAYKAANNEWRGTLADQRSSFIPRIEYESKHEALAKANIAAVAALSAQLTDAMGRLKLIEGRSTGIGSAVSLVISVAAIIAAVFATLHR